MDPETSTASSAAHVAAMREFNRFYTARLGLLNRRHLAGEFSLTEARILYEIGANPQITATTLRAALRLDAGYISRLLSSLAKRKLVRPAVSTLDRRERRLTLSPLGEKKFALLNEQSAVQIAEILDGMSASDRNALVQSLSKAQSILLQERPSPVRIVRSSKMDDDVLRLINEYYEAVNVTQRDTRATIRKMIQDRGSGVWLAYLGNQAVGCVVLKPLPSIGSAVECKRLYVQPGARGQGLANKLLDSIETFARDHGLTWIYLDSFDALEAAVALYKKRGYVPCARYNDNPQATIFLRKKVTPPGRLLRRPGGAIRRR
jgi:DNA-binding MarR family transcriptional regulator/GNAT superfamily N-acetyltransferase